MVPKFEKRVKAFAADLSALSIALIIAVFGFSTGPMYVKVGIIVGVYILIAIIPIIKTKGQTFGKRMQQIRVVNKDGSEASIVKLILRDIFKIGLSIFTFGIYSIIAFFALSEKHVSMTIHDHIFRTKVIDLSRPVRKGSDDYLEKSNSLTKKGL